MPELPEVETLKRQLVKSLKGQKILGVKVRRERSFRGSQKSVVGRKIKNIERKAKYLLVELSGLSKLYLVIHLKMTGQLIFAPEKGKRIVGGHPTADWVEKLPSKHTRVELQLSKGRLFFNDMRVFGWIKVMDSDEVKAMKNRLPADVVDKEFTPRYLRKILEGSKRSVKMIIMDQTKMGGMGNIYANDALNYAGISPRTTGTALVKDEKWINKLYIALKRVIGEGINHNGASDTNYVHLDGLGGSYQDHFLVYKQQGKPCKKPACRQAGVVIKKEKLGGRGTYWCPNCQAELK